jgi:hypothetical protein
MNERPTSHHITARHASIARRNESDFPFSQHQSIIGHQIGGIDRNEMNLKLHIGGRSFQSIQIDFFKSINQSIKFSLCFFDTFAALQIFPLFLWCSGGIMASTTPE